MSYSPALGRWMETDPIGTLAEHPDALGLERDAMGLSAPETGVTVTAIQEAVDKSIAKFGVEAVASNLQLLQYVDGANTYQFVSSNPVNATDPSGLDRYVVDGGMGHHGIAVDQWGIVNGKLVNLGPVTYDFSANYWLGPLLAGQLTGIPAAGMVRRTPGINGKIQSTIPSCPQADMTLQGNMDAAVINPPLYSLYWYNCNWFVLKHLLDGITK